MSTWRPKRRACHRSLAARIGAQTTTGGVVVVADTNQYLLLEDKHRLAGSPPGPAGLGWRPHPPRSTGHTLTGQSGHEPGRRGSRAGRARPMVDTYKTADGSAFPAGSPHPSGLTLGLT